MNFGFTAIALIAAAYFCGALPFGYWVGKLKGIDIREHGSKNIGATNVIRVLGKGVGIPVFILDMLKGFLPTYAAQRWMEMHDASASDVSWVGIGCVMAAVLGHTFTFWLGFKGGKGVATSAGGMLGLAPLALFTSFAVWVAVFYTTRYVAIASIVSAIVLPAVIALRMLLHHEWNFVLLGFGVLLSALVIARHRANIARLMAGTENKFEKKK